MTTPIPDRTATFRTFADIVATVERPVCEECGEPAFAALGHDGCVGLPELVCGAHAIAGRTFLAGEVKARADVGCADCKTYFPATAFVVAPI
jgi:hypothetical protein